MSSISGISCQPDLTHINLARLTKTAIEFLCDIETRWAEAVKRTAKFLPFTNGAMECLSYVFERQNLLRPSSASCGLLDNAFRAVTENKIVRSITYDPFEIFWSNPDEPKHSRLLWYFINPKAEHGCGLFLLQSFLSALKITQVELPVDESCDVTREDEHIDLLITRRGTNGKYAIVIENKVNGAIDQHEQLQTYYDVVRRRDFKDEQIFLCYLTLRGGRPGKNSIGAVETRLFERSFREHIIPWLEAVLCESAEWPSKMSDGMSDNLKHYLDLIRWRVNKEKIMERNKSIFEALNKADGDGRLPTLEEVIAVRESAQALEACYRRLKRAKTISAVQRCLHERYQLEQTDAFHDSFADSWQKTSEWYDDVDSGEYWFGFSVEEVVIVALGEDRDGIYTGYCLPKTRGQAKQFEEFVKAEEPSIFPGKSNEHWFSYTYHKNVDGTHIHEVDFLSDEIMKMYQNMNRLVKEFKIRLQPLS